MLVFAGNAVSVFITNLCRCGYPLYLYLHHIGILKLRKGYSRLSSESWIISYDPMGQVAQIVKRMGLVNGLPNPAMYEKSKFLVAHQFFSLFVFFSLELKARLVVLLTLLNSL